MSEETKVEEAPSEEASKYYTRAEVAQRNNNKEAWIIIHNSVYDVTNFLAEHPGGEEVLLEQAGKESTEPFEDVAHSSDAREMMKPLKVGEIILNERTKKDDKKSKNTFSGSAEDEDASGSWRSWVIPVAIGLLVTIIYRYFISPH